MKHLKEKIVKETLKDFVNNLEQHIKKDFYGIESDIHLEYQYMHPMEFKVKLHIPQK